MWLLKFLKEHYNDEAECDWWFIIIQQLLMLCEKKKLLRRNSLSRNVIENFTGYWLFKMCSNSHLKEINFFLMSKKIVSWVKICWNKGVKKNNNSMIHSFNSIVMFLNTSNRALLFEYVYDSSYLSYPFSRKL